MTPGCVIVGDVMMDINAAIDGDIAYASDTPASITMLPGGVAANTAAWMAATGNPATLVGCVGSDPFGRSIRGRLESIGVDVRLREGAGATGTCVVIVDRRKERTMFPDPGANSEFTLDDAMPWISSGTHVHLSGYTFMNPRTRDAARGILDHAGAVGASVSLDPASAAPLRSHLALFRDLLPHLDLLLANEAEASVLADVDEPHLALETLGDAVPCVVVKLGPRGVVACLAGEQVVQAAIPTEVIDTTGAGDAFTAGFLPAWRRGEPLSAALFAGQEVAARCVGRVGASPLDV